MRILQLCKKFPYPPKDGEAIAILNLTRSLSALGHEVTVLALNTKKHHFDINALPEAIDHIATFYAVDIDTDVKLWDAFKNLFSDKSYHIERFVSSSFRARLVELLTQNDYDIIQLETIYLGPYVNQIRRYSNAKIALRAHNVEHEIWERLTFNHKSGLKKRYLKLLTQKLKTYELSNLNSYDLLVPITKRDESAFLGFGWKRKSHVLPVGIDLSALPAVESKKNSPSIFFIGGMDWLPNLEGVQWFLKKVWPGLIGQHPDLKFYLAGRNMPKSLITEKVKGLVVLGEVEDAYEFMQNHSIMIVPLHSGSGMRIKIIEAMALKRGIVSTAIGAEGIEYTNRTHLMIADSEAAFLAAINELLENNSLLQSIGENARKQIEAKYDNLRLTEELISFYQSNMEE